MDIRDRLNELRMWHENLTWELMDWFGWDEYQMLWVAYAEGLLLGLLIWWIFEEQLYYYYLRCQLLLAQVMTIMCMSNKSAVEMICQ